MQRRHNHFDFLINAIVKKSGGANETVINVTITIQLQVSKIFY